MQSNISFPSYVYNDKSNQEEKKIQDYIASYQVQENQLMLSKFEDLGCFGKIIFNQQNQAGYNFHFEYNLLDMLGVRNHNVMDLGLYRHQLGKIRIKKL